MKTNFGLLPSDLECIKTILLKHSAVEIAYFFGSRAKGNFKTGSDVDLALKGFELINETISRISFQLNEESRMPYRFDVINYHTIESTSLIEHIDPVGVEIYGRLG